MPDSGCPFPPETGLISRPLRPVTQLPIMRPVSQVFFRLHVRIARTVTKACNPKVCAAQRPTLRVSQAAERSTMPGPAQRCYY